MVTAFASSASRPLHPAAWASGLLAASLAAAGLIHLWLMPEHLAESTLMGLGFCAAGITQLALGTLVLVRPWRGVFVAVIAMSLALMAMFAFNVFVGLPFAHAATEGHAATEVHAAAEVHVATEGHAATEGHPATDAHAAGDDNAAGVAQDHHAGGLVLGGGEPIDAFGAVTQAAQIAAIGLAAYVLMRARDEGIVAGA